MEMMLLGYGIANLDIGHILMYIMIIIFIFIILKAMVLQKYLSSLNPHPGIMEIIRGV